MNELVITNIHHTLKGFTKPGEHFYHNRSSYELGLRLNGESVSTSNGKTFFVKKNEVVFKPRGSSDSCRTDTGVEFCSVWFDLKDEPTLPFQVFSPEQHEKVSELFRALEREERHNGVTAKCYALLYGIFSLLAPTRKYRSESHKTIFKKARDLIDENFYNAQFKTHDICETLGVSPSLLRLVFNECAQKSPVSFLLDRRLEQAKKLLSYSDSTILEIAELCGFDSPFYFSRQFKKHFGVAPSFFRETE